LEVQLQQHAKRTGQSRIHRDREIEGEHVTALEQFLERWQRYGISGLQIPGVGTPRRTERRLHRGVMVEQREKDDHAFGD